MDGKEDDDGMSVEPRLIFTLSSAVVRSADVVVLLDGYLLLLSLGCGGSVAYIITTCF